MFRSENSYFQLPDRFYERLNPTVVSEPKLIQINGPLAQLLGIDSEWLVSVEGVEMLAGNRIPAGAEPLAMAYAGHQFGNWVPQLGDGRAILLGEIRARDGIVYDIQLKGAGPTAFSRNGDGRAALGPVLREYIVSEAMHALGIPTTRALAAVTTGDYILRQEGMLHGAILTRASKSHVRVGTFEYFANQGDAEGVRILADYVMARLYPETANAAKPYVAFLEAVIARTASLIAKWQLVGFIHGVMNTDNTSIAGETLDFGPCAFMDAYNPAQVFSAIDRDGRYAYENQPRIAHWNLVQLAQALMPLLDPDEVAAAKVAQGAVDKFPAVFELEYLAGLRAKVGITHPADDDLTLIGELLSLMADGHADFTLTFRRLCDSADGNDDGLRELFESHAALDIWLEKWRRRLAVEGVSPNARSDAMREVNPAFIPRNHLIESVIVAAQKSGDFAPFEKLLEALSAPYEQRPEFASYALPPAADEIVTKTFCGTYCGRSDFDRRL